MNHFPKIYVAGHRGMVGSAIVRRLVADGMPRDAIVTRTHAELDLTDQAAVRAFFADERPEQVYLAAARVGGIHANNTFPADFIYDNLMIEANIVDAAFRNGVRKLLFLGSSCIYPRLAPQPMQEAALLTGTLEATNEPYAIAKIAGIKLCESYSRQRGRQYVSVMTCNLYGPGDNYDLASSQVLPALLRKAHEATLRGASELVVWGSGAARREFPYVDDLADACVHLMERDWSGGLLNIGSGEDVSIRELAETVMEVVSFQERIVFDASKPDGTLRKLLDVSRLAALGWQARTGLAQGIRLAYDAAPWRH
jgi:GDP-L-fucose synthase